MSDLCICPPPWGNDYTPNPYCAEHGTHAGHRFTNEGAPDVCDTCGKGQGKP